MASVMLIPTADGAWLEQYIGATGTFCTDCDDVAVWKLVDLPLLGTEVPSPPTKSVTV